MAQKEKAEKTPPFNNTTMTGRIVDWTVKIGDRQVGIYIDLDGKGVLSSDEVDKSIIK